MPSPSPARHQPAALAKALGTIIPLHRWLLALSVLIVVLAASPASAQTCKVSKAPAFGTVTIADIVSKGGSLASTSADIEYECTPDGHEHPETYQICVAIYDPKQPVPNASHIFFQTGSDGSRIAWVADNSDTVSGGPLSPLVVTADNRERVSKGKMRLTVTYLDRQQQDLVRSGTYKNEYRLVSSTLSSREWRSECPSQTDIIASANSSTIFTLETIVLPTCQLENKGQSATNFDSIDFGTIGALSAANASAGNIRATTNIDVRCTYQTSYDIDLDNGKHFEGGTRRMRNGDNFLAYQLFNKTASGTSSPWSKLSGTKGNAVNAVNTHTVEGQLTPISVAPAAGNYTDTIVVTLTF